MINFFIHKKRKQTFLLKTVLIVIEKAYDVKIKTIIAVSEFKIIRKTVVFLS